MEFRYFKNNHDLEFEFLDCSTNITNEDDAEEWKKVPISFDHFKCAKLDSPCNRYMVDYLEKYLQEQY